MDICKFLSNKVKKALVLAGAPIDSKIHLQPSVSYKFGDYQVNSIMEIAKKMGISSITLAKDVVSFINLKGIACQIDIAGPGFINIFLDNKWLEKHIMNTIYSSRLGVTNVIYKKNIIVDYSAPNVAKEMHVGHVRSTIIGDVSVRILKFLGHNVIRANHIGDWGTQFGMLIAYIDTINDCNEENVNNLSNLDKFYRLSKKLYDEDKNFSKIARDYVVKLQNGDKNCLKIWRKLVNVSILYNQKIYERLNVTLTKDDIMGESLYNTMLPDIVSDLKNKGIAVENEKAVVVILNEFKSKKGNPIGVVIQKKDGAYLYTTTDIACVKYRYDTFKADRIIYYVDSRQCQHLMQVWTIARKAGYIPESVLLEHHMFGMILGKNGKPFKTREGSTIKLMDLLDEAFERARILIFSKYPNIDLIKLNKLATIVSIGAVKYSDLSKNRTTNYIFDLDSMLNFDGNTAIYIQYSYARIFSILNKYCKNENQIIGNVYLFTVHEKKLAVQLLQLEDILFNVANYGTPHILCSYLYNIAVLYSSFYENCPILKAKNKTLCQSRLMLSLLTARILEKGLNLLGIETVDWM